MISRICTSPTGPARWCRSGALVDVRRVLGSELITHYNLYPAAPLVGSPAPGYSSGEALSIMERIANANLPQNIGYNWTGLSYQEKLIGNQAYFIFALSIALVFLVLAAQYESWSNPAAVDYHGAHGPRRRYRRADRPGLPQRSVSLKSVSFCMIALAAKNAILIVEFARELKAEGMSTADAAVEATRRRFRPILMTSIAFILGVVPLMTATGAGAASQQSLGTVVFGGMLASTLLAIPFVSVFYIVMEGFRRTATGTEGNRKRALGSGGAQDRRLNTLTGGAPVCAPCRAIG